MPRMEKQDTVIGRSDLLEAAVDRLRKLDAVARGENRHGSVVIEIVYRDGIPQFYRENQRCFLRKNKRWRRNWA